MISLSLINCPSIFSQLPPAKGTAIAKAAGNQPQFYDQLVFVNNTYTGEQILGAIET